MFRVITTNCAEGTLAVAALQRALLEESEDGLAQAEVVNGLLCSALEETPERREEILLDAFQSVLGPVRMSCATKAELERRKEKLAGVCAALFRGLGYLEFEALWGLMEEFSALRREKGGAEECLLAAAEGWAEDYPILTYLLRRELLNQLMRTARFAQRKELVDALSAALRTAPEALVRVAEEAGVSLFFFGAGGRRG